MSEDAKIAYDAYVESAGGVSLVTGQILPNFEDLPEDIKRAWEAVACVLYSEFLYGGGRCTDAEL